MRHPARTGLTPLLAVTALAWLGGCGAEPPPAAGEPVLSPITYAAWLERLRDYAPDIVVVDFWATWCTPCIERFPRMVELSARYRGGGVLDEPLLGGFRLVGLLGIPAVYVYDRSGALHARLTADDPARQFDEADVEAAILALLED